MRPLRAAASLICLFVAFINVGNGLWFTVPALLAAIGTMTEIQHLRGAHDRT